jgi:hypothetical protein
VPADRLDFSAGGCIQRFEQAGRIRHAAGVAVATARPACSWQSAASISTRRWIIFPFTIISCVTGVLYSGEAGAG